MDTSPGLTGVNTTGQHEQALALTRRKPKGFNILQTAGACGTFYFNAHNVIEPIFTPYRKSNILHSSLFMLIIYHSIVAYVRAMHIMRDTV